MEEGSMTAQPYDSASPRPRALIFPALIPESLRHRDQWVNWQWALRGARWTKPPYQPSGAAASTTDPATWSPFDVVWAAYQAGRADGVGFVFSPDDPYCGLDQDHVRDPVTRAVEPAAWARVQLCASYTETSPSGRGVHTIVEARLTDGGRRHGEVEVYDRGRYFTMTGNHAAGTPGTIAPAEAAIQSILASFPVPAPNIGGVSAKWEGRGSIHIDPRTTEYVLARARAARNGGKLDRLWAGHDHGYPTTSEADLGMLGILIWWTDDPATLDALFRQSGRMRPKWDEPHAGDGRTYGELTIGRALARRGVRL
jgi:putative DNA primase/helicase